MKKFRWYLLIIFILFGVQITTAQQGKEKSEIQQEIQYLKNDIKELEAEIKEAEKDDPDEAAQLRKELAMLTRALQMLEGNLPAINQSENSKEIEVNREDPFFIPEPDNKRINDLPKLRQSGLQISEFCKETEEEFEKTMSEEMKKLGGTLYANYQANEKKSPEEIANIGVGMWMMGRMDLSTYLTGRAFMSDPSDNNIMNNYASMLSMSGFEDRAIVLLEKLNKKFPNNSTILNNLGQAWMGLGDREEAKKNINMALSIYKKHPEANLAKACLLVEKGDKNGAAKAIKESLDEGFSDLKIEMLEKLGYKIAAGDIKWVKEKLPYDFMGFRRLFSLVPEYPLNTVQAILLEPEWSKFYNMLDNELESLRNQQDAFQPIYLKSTEQFAEDQILLKKKFSPTAIKFIRANYSSLIEPYLFTTVPKELSELTEKAYKIDQRNSEDLTLLSDQLNNPDLSYETKLKLQDDFFSSANSNWKSFQDKAYLERLASIHDSLAYIHMYYLTPTEETYQNYLFQVKVAFLTRIKAQKYVGWNPSFISPESNPIIKHRNIELPLFESPVCSGGEDFNTLIGSIKTTCNYISFEFKLPIHKNVSVDGSYTENLNTGKFVKGTVGVEVSTGIGSQKSSNINIPLELGVKGSMGMGLEFDQNGLSDVYMTSGAKAGVSVNSLDINDTGNTITGTKKYISADLLGVKSKVSLNSGGVNSKLELGSKIKIGDVPILR